MSSFDKPEPKKLSVNPEEEDFGRENPYKNLKSESQIKDKTELTPAEILQILLEVQRKSTLDPIAELTQLEASLVYQVDKDLPESATKLDNDDEVSVRDLVLYIKERRGFDEEAGDEEVKQLPDYEQVKSLIIDRLISETNVISTSNALKEIMEGLGVEGYTPAIYMNTLKEKMKVWEERGVFDYLAVELIRNNNRHNVVPVPNAEFDSKQLISLAHIFGEATQPGGQATAIIWDEQVNGPIISKYSPKELSDPVDNVGPIKISLIPIKSSDKLFGKVTEQLENFNRMQQTNPNANLHCPSLLDSISNWFVLEAHGYLGDYFSESIEEITKTPLFNLPTKDWGELHASPMLLYSGLSYGGMPGIMAYDSNYPSFKARVAVA